MGVEFPQIIRFDTSNHATEDTHAHEHHESDLAAQGHLEVPE